MSPVVGCYLVGMVGAGVGCFVYDVAKLVRRDIRRKRKLGKELGGSNASGHAS
jgi:hypothetical protein